MKHKFLQLTTFTAGMVIMILEMLGFRLFAPYFGYSIYVSGSLIGMVMLALSIGYYIGGILADRNSDTRIMYKLILAASAYVFITGFSYEGILFFLSGLGVVYGSLVSSLLIFGPPMIFLSIVTPFVIKVFSKEYKVGMSAGRISSIATVGSIFGIFLSSYFLIPNLGSHMTLYTSAVILLLVSIAGMVKVNKKYFLLIFLILIFNPFPTRSGENVLYQGESLYNTIKVTEDNNEITLITGSDKWVQSVYSKNGLIDKRYYYYFMNIAPLITETDDILIIGMGAGTSAKQFLDLFDANVDGVEIDGEIAELSYEYFGLSRDDPRLEVYVEDARQFLRRSQKEYDVVEVDIYNCAYIPFYLSTEEFFESVYDALSPEGVLIMNVYSPFADTESELVGSVGYTIGQIFPSTYNLDLGSNNILFATKNPTTIDEIRGELNRNTVKEFEHLVSMSGEIKEFESPENPILLTDDKSSIEIMSHGRY